MCGIAGYLIPDERPSQPELVARMVAAIRHRGPDADGIFTAPGIGLGHARLSIIDLAGGAQPMKFAADKLVISFNGEIFNYIELRDSLIRQGRIFRTQSDTEVILHLYDIYGPDCVDHLNGDFAFALWDACKQRLMLARDRMGVRPLHYVETRDGLYFASEIKALLTVPNVGAEPDPLALDQIFTFWFPLSPRTPFKDIFELPPGHVLLADRTGIRLRSYWQLSFPDVENQSVPDAKGERAIEEELRALLFDAVRIRLRSDVPTGTYLSGGLDSSIISAMAAKLMPERLKTFSVTFDNPEFDESVQQRAMAENLGTDHHAAGCSAAMIASHFPQVVRHAERPLLRTGPAPLYVLADHVRQSGVKTVLTGEGADEVFAGYDIFKEAKLRRFVARQPESTRRPLLFQRLYPYLPRLQQQSPAYLNAFFAAGDDLADPLYSHRLRFRSASGAKLFFTAALRDSLKGYDALDDLRGTLPGDFPRWHPLHQAQFLEMAHLLPGYILSSQGDRMAMAHGVESRFPFLDHRLVEFAARIPPVLKLKGLREKHILRESVAGLLPRDILNRPKQPYRAPEGACFTGGTMPAYVREMLSPEGLSRSGFFETKTAGRLVQKFNAGGSLGARDNMALTGLLSSQLWHDNFIQTSTHSREAQATGQATGT